MKFRGQTHTQGQEGDGESAYTKLSDEEVWKAFATNIWRSVDDRVVLARGREERYRYEPIPRGDGQLRERYIAVRNQEGMQGTLHKTFLIESRTQCGASMKGNLRNSADFD